MADTRTSPTSSIEQGSTPYTAPDWAAEAIREGKSPADAGIAEAGKRTITSGTKLAAGLVLATAAVFGGSAPGKAEAAEDAATCRARIIAEYDLKISQAQGAGNEKAVSVYTRQRGWFLEKCDKLGVIAQNQRETTAIQRETTAIQRETTEYSALSPILSKISNNTPLSMSDIQALERGYEAIQKLPSSPTSERYLRELRNILAKLGRSV